jgi:hypothetical protein
LYERRESTTRRGRGERGERTGEGGEAAVSVAVFPFRTFDDDDDVDDDGNKSLFFVRPQRSLASS